MPRDWLAPDVVLRLGGIDTTACHSWTAYRCVSRSTGGICGDIPGATAYGPRSCWSNGRPELSCCVPGTRATYTKSGHESLGPGRTGSERHFSRLTWRETCWLDPAIA